MAQKRNKVQTTVGLDLEFLIWLRAEAARRGVGWSTLLVTLALERRAQIQAGVSGDWPATN